MLKPAYDKVLVLALATPVLVLTTMLACSPSKGADAGVTPQFWAERRAAARIEARLTHPEADRHRPRVSSGGCPVPPEPIPLRELARLEEAGDWGGIAAAYALQGEWNQAASFLERMPASPDRDTDLAAVHLARGAHEKALRLLDAVLASHPKHPQALWNRALVLQEMGLTMKAAETYEQVASLNEPGWGREAHAHALTLREETLERARKWKGARDATLALMDDAQAPLPLDEARQHPGVVRQHFYEVVRSASSKERAMGLLPLAQELDRLQGGTALGDYVRRVAARDFARRGGLARGYAELVRSRTQASESMLDTLRASGEDDLFLGAVLRTRGALGYLADAVERGRRQQDPWFHFYLEREQARKEMADGEWWKAEQRLFSALQRCREGALSARCVELELRLGILYAELRRLTEAERHAHTAWTWARQLREWELELTSLEMLAHISRDRGDFSSARAYVEEWSARGGRFNTCYWPQVNLAHIHFLDMRPEDARRALEAAAACPTAPLDHMFGATFAEMARTHPASGDAELLRRTLAARASNPMPGDAVYTRYIEGRFMLDREREQGQALLRRAIDEAEKLPRADTLAREAWTLSYSSLITDAGRTGDYVRVLELMAAQLGTSVPSRCALAAAVHHERAVVVARGADGRVEGHYDENREEPFSRSPTSRLVPEGLRQKLRGCERVDVLAWAPVFGRTDLLPPDMAWSFRMGRTAQPRTASGGRRLVVSSVEAPSLLQLPRLPAWTPPPEPGPTPLELLSGSEATPSRVLSSMSDATEIEIHAHGISDPALSDASLVVLSPEGNGRYALTADVVRQQRLMGSPLVYLAACSAGRLASSTTHEPFSLPAAFIDAGARAVLASTVDIPDAAGRFFDGVRQRIRAGTSPAEALRDERRKWLERDSRNGWTQHVLLVETSE
ncbi:CHAT domain-containing protein [Myxococcus sp. RHSTA-1-4]|uniref:CHAT domain-containing protein n=1 Tax=Myxococcus sp. RHSTA-1-4 TaxID=2874601 RepID=UPI001CBB0901|nr:CHAT domain-containing protein [Myxococcus sp. RHSTA-1-4]MBZ4415399.1 CHAT domain-containing protein [Myxococcus sp. RHSTA-1-4]